MFRLVNVDGRAALDHEGAWFDLARLADDLTLADPRAAVARHVALHALAERCATATPDGAVADVELGPPVPDPRQVFAIGLNYGGHADESGLPRPTSPMTFTKFPSCLAGPTADIPLSGPAVDWEVEVVAVIGRTAHRVPVDEAWGVVGGLTLGQDVSDRIVQFTDEPAQFSLGKSYPGYGPIGPALVSLDAFADPDDVSLWCEVDGDRVQDGRTSDLIFPIPALVAHLSSICTLHPGDLIFTGTPSGVGVASGRFLAPGQLLRSGADQIGELANRCTGGDDAVSP